MEKGCENRRRQKAWAAWVRAVQKSLVHAPAPPLQSALRAGWDVGCLGDECPHVAMCCRRLCLCKVRLLNNLSRVSCPPFFEAHDSGDAWEKALQKAGSKLR